MGLQFGALTAFLTTPNCHHRLLRSRRGLRRFDIATCPESALIPDCRQAWGVCVPTASSQSVSRFCLPHPVAIPVAQVRPAKSYAAVAHYVESLSRSSHQISGCSRFRRSDFPRPIACRPNPSVHLLDFCGILSNLARCGRRGCPGRATVSFSKNSLTLLLSALWGENSKSDAPLNTVTTGVTANLDTASNTA